MATFQNLIRFSLFWISAAADIISLEQGVLEGTTGVSQNGTIFKAYYNIPYAKPPLNLLRFQPPKYPDHWHGILNASIPSSQDNGCVQAQGIGEPFKGKEDCLMLDIFTPHNATKGSNIPVIFFIFGGRFLTGYAAKSGPDYVMNFNVILVRPNFRLGILGMISTGDSIISGNMGLKDQSMALKWVKKNIFMFGGDPNRVTLQGHSSGASSVELHSHSPLSKGLFHRAILMSGIGYGSTLIQNQLQAKNEAHSIARLLNCNEYNSSQEILICLLNKTPQELSDVANDLLLWNGCTILQFYPVLENPGVKDAFLTDIWWKSAPQPTNVSWLIGSTTAEIGYLVAGFIQKETVPTVEQIKRKPFLYIPIFGYFKTLKPNLINFISQAAYNYYIGNDEIGKNIDVQLTQLLTDLEVTYPTLSSIRQFDGTKYVYLFNYRSNFSIQMYDSDYPKYLGPSHMDDFLLVYRRAESEGSLTSEDYAFGNEMIKRHVNFAYTGNPNEPYAIDESIFGYWTPSISQYVDYLSIDIKGKMITGFKTDQFKFLSKLPLINNFD